MFLLKENGCVAIRPSFAINKLLRGRSWRTRFSLIKRTRSYIHDLKKPLEGLFIKRVEAYWGASEADVDVLSIEQCISQYIG